MKNPVLAGSGKNKDKFGMTFEALYGIMIESFSNTVDYRSLRMTSKKSAFFLYGSIALLVTAALGLSSFMSVGNGERFKAVMLFAVFVMFLCGVIIVRLGLPEQYIFYVILAAGIAMRVGYAIYTYADVRQHDVWETVAGPGHFQYIYDLYTNGKLPDSYAGQYYHGPLSHAMTALFLRLVSLAGIDPFADGSSWIQVVPCALSCFVIVVVYKTAGELKLNERVCLTAAALTAFHPAFYILAGSVNNDMAMIFFFFTGILYTVRYFNLPTMKNILVLALSIGCSMMSKLSGGMIALFTGSVFLAVFVICVRQSGSGGGAAYSARFPQFAGLTIKKLIGQFAAFLAVCAPLGLWHSLRNLIVLGQPMGYVPAPPIDGDLYIGWHGLKERLFAFPLSEYFGSWCNPREDYHLWIFMLKSALFGEWEYNVPRLIADSFLLFSLILVLVFAVSVFRGVRKKEAHPILRFGLPLLTVSQLALYVNFNIGYPFGCTMDFRYIAPVILPFSVFTALAAARTDQGKARWQKAAASVIYSLIGGFCALSVLFYVIL